jgi:hypothetical protein
MILADLGATVIHIDRPAHTDTDTDTGTGTGTGRSRERYAASVSLLNNNNNLQAEEITINIYIILTSHKYHTNIINYTTAVRNPLCTPR